MSKEIEALNLLKIHMDNYIDYLAEKERWLMTIIVDKKIPFPKNLYCVKHDPHISVTTERWNEHPRQGWGTKPPDIMIGKDIEIWRFKERYLKRPVFTTPITNNK